MDSNRSIHMYVFVFCVCVFLCNLQWYPVIITLPKGSHLETFEKFLLKLMFSFLNNDSISISWFYLFLENFYNFVVGQMRTYISVTNSYKIYTPTPTPTPMHTNTNTPVSPVYLYHNFIIPIFIVHTIMTS